MAEDLSIFAHAASTPIAIQYFTDPLSSQKDCVKVFARAAAALPARVSPQKILVKLEK